MRLYPLFLRLKGRAVLIVGGGAVATRKASALQEAGAIVTVIAPEINEELTTLAHACVRRAAGPEDIHADWRLVILATNDLNTQEFLAQQCAKQNILYNRCDIAEESEFVTGGTFYSEPFLAAVIASGSPGMARMARARIAQALEPALCQLAQEMNRLRDRIKKTFVDPEERRAFHARWENEPTVERIRQQGIEAVREEIERCLCS